MRCACSNASAVDVGVTKVSDMKDNGDSLTTAHYMDIRERIDHLDDKICNSEKQLTELNGRFPLLVGCAVVGVGIFIVVDKNFMSEVFGNSLMTASAYCIIVAGAVVLIISFLGCCGALQENKCMLIVYFVVLLLIFLFFLVGGILAIIYRSQVGEHVRQYMRTTLQQDYGVNLNDPYHQRMTDAWNQAQEKLYCCAVEENSWGVYRLSEWYKIQPGVPQQGKPLVPLSCCRRGQNGQYTHKVKCQTWPNGPPALPSGESNEALHYKGCYEAGKEYVYEMTGYLMGMGLALAVVMIVGMLFAICLYRMV